MRLRSLVVDDDAKIIETVGDILASLNHDCDSATDQEAARKLLAADRYSYVLLDLEIPVKPGRLCRVENGKNLLAEIRRTSGMDTVPVIVMTGHGHDSPDLAVSVMKIGAVDYVKKPFDRDSLDKAIREALAKAGNGAPVPSARAASKKAAAFKDAKRRMVIDADRVTVCDVEVWSDHAQPDLRNALIALSEKKDGRFVRIRGAKLDKDLGRNASNPIARRIKDLRDGATKALKEIGLDCGAADILASNTRSGYHFTDWMDVQVAGSSPGSRTKREPARDGREPAREPGEPADEPLNERQRWILGQIDRDVRLRINDIVSHTKKNRSTVNRDLKGLRDRAHDRIRLHEDGYYVRAAPPADGQTVRR